MHASIVFDLDFVERLIGAKENGVLARELNRPGFTGEFFVQNLCGFFKGDHARMECVLPFLRRPVANGAV